MTNVTKNNFYVYLIRRPNLIPCYVGKGRGARWTRHAWRSTNPHLANIYAQNGGVLPIEKVAQNLTEEEAFALERRLIAFYGREPNGPLVNMTDGGDGISGFKMPAHVGALNSIRHKGNKYRLGMKASAETKTLQSALKLGRKQAPEVVEARVAPLRNRKRPPDVCAAISAGKTGKSPRKYNWSPEARARQKERFADPELRAKISVGTKVGNAKPDAKVNRCHLGLTEEEMIVHRRKNAKLRQRTYRARKFRRQWENASIFVWPYSQWGDGASAGILSCA